MNLNRRIPAIYSPDFFCLNFYSWMLRKIILAFKHAVRYIFFYQRKSKIKAQSIKKRMSLPSLTLLQKLKQHGN